MTTRNDVLSMPSLESVDKRRDTTPVAADSGLVSDVVRTFSVGDLMTLVARNAFKVNHCYVLHHNLKKLPLTPPRLIGGGELRKLTCNDIEQLHDKYPTLGLADKLELFTRLRFFKNGFTDGYVLEVDGNIAYLHWIISPSENDLIRASYRKKLLPLRDNEKMIDNAFTFPAYRGLGFMPHVVWQLLNRCREHGCRRVITYARKDNVNSLNVLCGMGFKITKLVSEYKLLGYGWRSF